MLFEALPDIKPMTSLGLGFRRSVLDSELVGVEADFSGFRSDFVEPGRGLLARWRFRLESVSVKCVWKLLEW